MVVLSKMKISAGKSHITVIIGYDAMWTKDFVYLSYIFKRKSVKVYPVQLLPLKIFFECQYADVAQRN